MSDALGAMRHRVTLQKPTRVADEIGGAAIAWSNEGVAWAEIEALAGGDAPAFDVQRSVSSFRVSMHRRDDVRAGWRLLWGERRLRVVSAADDGAPKLSLICEEEFP